MKYFRAALLAAFVLCMRFDTVFGQDIPTLRLDIPGYGQPNGLDRGAQSLGINGALLRERRQTWMQNDGGFQSASIRISRSTTSSRTAFPIAYSLEYFVVVTTPTIRNTVPANVLSLLSKNSPLPNVSTDVRQLPERVIPEIIITAPVFTPPLPAPVATAINGLQGDLSPTITLKGRPTTAVNTTLAEAPGAFTLDEDVNELFINFTSRWNDQNWNPRNPGIQGLRVALLRLLPSTSNPPAYRLQSGLDSAYVLLLDPQQNSPIITNALPDISLLRPTGMVPTEYSIELESPQWRPDNVPGSVFYDDNYDVITYTATSSDASRVSATVTRSSASNTPLNSRLYIAVQPGAEPNTQAVISVRALDGSQQDDGARRLATDEFIVYIRSALTVPTTSVAKTTELPSIATSPNPVVDKCTVSAVIPDVGFFTLRLTDVKGNILVSTSIEGTRGREQSHTIDMTGFAAGTYFVEVNDGKATSTKKIVKM